MMSNLPINPELLERVAAQSRALIDTLSELPPAHQQPDAVEFLTLLASDAAATALIYRRYEQPELAFVDERACNAAWRDGGAA
jgi:hypothetical protein